MTDGVSDDDCVSGNPDGMLGDAAWFARMIAFVEECS